MKRLTQDDLLARVRELFEPPVELHSRSNAIGAELELIPFNATTGKRILATEGTPSGSELLASVAREFHWTEERMGADPSSWNFTDGRVTFEPGGQIEFSSAVFQTASSLLEAAGRWISILQTRARDAMIELKTLGIDDRNPIDDVPLQLQRDRYARMTRYFNSVGPHGVVMMRQTASLQINVERGDSPLTRWRLLNALAPWFVAIFANSPRYAGVETGHKSYRAHIWRMLDHTRTGIVYNPGREAERYLEFAMGAPFILNPGEGEFPSFRDLLSDGRANSETWETHLSTLFPEIRPRDYFEIRSIDAIPLSHLPAAIAFVCGIVYDERSSALALEFLGAPDRSLLESAGQRGLEDRRIRSATEKLIALALDGCDSLGTDYLAAGQKFQAEEFFNHYTLNGRTPADIGQFDPTAERFAHENNFS